MQIRLGQNIRKLRRNAGLTQEQLAEALGVTTGAVHKWESGKAAPELGMLVDIARFFETSVDALLDYGWEKLSMGQAADKISAYRAARDFAEGFRFAEQAMQKYPNSFDVVYQSALLYFMSIILYRGKSAEKAIELFSRAIELIDQNTCEEIGVITIQNDIAGCYCYLGQMDKAIDLLKKNNVGGLNDAKIGLFMSQEPSRAGESLRYLSNALHNYYARIYEVCIGYANAYSAMGELDKTEELLQWLLGVGKGLKEPGSINIIDKTDVRIYTILAEMGMLKGDEACAYRWLKEAQKTALRFDSAPQYRTAHGMKYYHSSPDSMSYDDMGETGMAMIENFMADDEAGRNLRPIWERIQVEGQINRWLGPKGIPLEKWLLDSTGSLMHNKHNEKDSEVYIKNEEVRAP